MSSNGTKPHRAKPRPKTAKKKPARRLPAIRVPSPGDVVDPFPGREKSAQKSVPGVPFMPGEDPRRGKGPEPGTGGRPPNEFKELCRKLATRTKTVAQVLAILKSAENPQFMAALRWASEHGYGKPTQPVDVGVQDSLAALLMQQPGVRP